MGVWCGEMVFRPCRTPALPPEVCMFLYHSQESEARLKKLKGKRSHSRAVLTHSLCLFFPPKGYLHYSSLFMIQVNIHIQGNDHVCVCVLAANGNCGVRHHLARWPSKSITCHLSAANVFIYF